MTLRPLHRLCRLFQAQYRNSAVAYLLFRRLLVQRLAGQEAPWLKLFFRNSAPVLPPELQRQANALLAQLSVRPEGAPDGLTPQTLALAHEIFAANGKAKGIFYTPFSLARHLARQALHAALIRQAGLDEATAQALLEGTSPAEPLARQTDDWLSRLTCCDPAAGAGGLLVPFALELSRLRKTLCPDRDEGELLAFILSRNLFAADLSAPALEDLQLRAALVLAQYGRTPSARPLAQVFQGDVLAQANGQSVLEKAFEPVFSQRGGFDVILSNPPYIGQKNHRAVFEALRHNPLWEKLAEPKSDLLYFFFYLALKTLKPGGIGAFLTTPYFASAAGGQKLRQTLREQAAFLYLEDFGEQRLFRRALGQHSLLSVFEKNDSAAKPPCLMDCRQLPQNSLYQGPEHYLITRPAAPALKSALDKMAACPHTLQDVAHVSNGLMTGCDKISAAHLRRHRLPGVKKGDGVFVLSPAEKGALPLTPTEEAKLKPFFKNSDLHPYYAAAAPSGWLVDFFYPNDRGLDLAQYPHLRAHLARFAPVLLARRQNNNGIHKLLARQIYWFGSVRRKLDFEADKIAVPQRAARNTFALAPGPWYASSDVYFISQPKGVSLWYLLGLFNSAPYFAWLYYRGKRKGRLLELYAAPLKALPVPLACAEQTRQLETLARQIYQLKSARPQADITPLQAQADAVVAEIFGFTPSERDAICQAPQDPR